MRLASIGGRRLVLRGLLEPDPSRWPRFEAPRVRRFLGRLKAEPIEACLPDLWIDYLHARRRRLHLTLGQYRALEAVALRQAAWDAMLPLDGRRKRPLDGRALAERYAIAHNPPWDWDAMAEIVHPDYVEDWPQSGERIVGFENKRAILENYPGRLPEGSFSMGRVVGGEPVETASSPGPIPFVTVIRLIGGGDTFTIEGTARYPSGDITHIVATVEIRDGKVWRATTYFAPPFDPPDWRSAWVERAD
jgi:hypothetical protein